MKSMGMGGLKGFFGVKLLHHHDAFVIGKLHSWLTELG